MSELADAIFGIQKKKQGPFFKGTWNAAESVDANLSSVTLAGDTDASRFIPKLSSVTGLSAGDGVLLVETSGGGKIIIGKIVGDVSLAS